MLKEDIIIKALEANCGLVTQTAKALNISRATIYKRINKSQSLKTAYEDIKMSMIDLAESKLFELIKQGNLTAIIFYLKCKGGYYEAKFDMPDAGGEQKIIIEYVDSKPKNEE
jgi:hypothetical protein